MAEQPDSRRRSERVVSQVPIRLEAPGGASGTGRTAVVNRHGALILCSIETPDGGDVQITNTQTGESAAGRVIWAGGKDAATGLVKYGVELLDDRPNFWGFEISAG
jgi:PilZ domain